ncbi:hypothetical protein HDU86_001498 [Geranomyces michiganensis]|nr:hypothetical protein HDU86_001498 [Geranomyces michiganensis]
MRKAMQSSDKSVMEKIKGPWKVAFMHMLIQYYYVWLEEVLEDVPKKRRLRQGLREKRRLRRWVMI